MTRVTVHCGQHSMKAPVLTANSNKQQENFIKVTTGNTTDNQTSLTQLEGMVPSENHTQKLKARDRLIGNAQPVKRGQREEGGGKTTGRDSQGPEGVTLKIVFEVILLLLTTKNAWQ